MDILEIIKNRRSIRKYKKEPIPKEYIQKLKQALKWAPSAGNTQARKFYFIFNQELKTKIAQASLNQMFISEAPLIVVACGLVFEIKQRYGERGVNLYMKLDIASALQNMMLMAYALGLGTCWIGAFDEKEISKILNLPEGEIVVSLTPVGFPQESPYPKPRKLDDELFVEI